MVQKYKPIVTPIKEQYAVRRRTQFPQASVDMFHLRLTDPCAVGFQSPNVRKDFFVLYVCVFARGRLVSEFR
jgi:hypothetical protein